MNDPVWVLPELVLAEHGGLPGIRDQALLDAALARPRQKAAYEADSTVFQLAAAYSYGLAKNHLFVDGNKRIALTIAAVFLDLNRYSLSAPEPEAVLVYQQLASSTLKEEELCRWLEAFSIPNAQQVPE